jgi:hypothetical protein
MSTAFNKNAFWSGKYLNDKNDTIVGGQVQSLPVGVTVSQGEQTLPGDRALLDAVTATLLSLTATGTLYSGVYMYVQTNSTGTVTPALGKAAFWVTLSSTVLENQYLVSCDATPSAAVPTYFAGVFLNAVTKGNYTWIQISGTATVLFDSALTATADGNWVTVKVSPGVTSTFDCGAVAGVVTLSAYIGTAQGVPATSTASKVFLTRGFGRW